VHIINQPAFESHLFHQAGRKHSAQNGFQQLQRPAARIIVIERPHAQRDLGLIGVFFIN